MPLLTLLGTSGSSGATSVINTSSLSVATTTIPGATYSLSFWVDPSAITNNTTTPQVQIGIASSDGYTGYLVGTILGTVVGRYALPNWVCPAGITTVILFAQIMSTATLAAGQKFKVSQPMWRRVG